MDVMAKAQGKKADLAAANLAAEGGARKLMRLHFELALEVGIAGKRPLRETLRNAVDAAGCDVVVELPTGDARGLVLIIRQREDGRDGFLQVRAAETGFDIADEDEIDPDLLSLARASIDVLERLKADGNVPEQSSPTAH